MYIKASNAAQYDNFGPVAMSADGNTLVVGAYNEASAATGVDGDQLDNSKPGAGAAYVFVRVAGIWMQQAYLKASATANDDNFGTRVAISGDGTTIAVSATGVQTGRGAVYMFTRGATTWTQQAMLQASNADPGDQFGGSLALSSDGTTLAVGARNEASAATTINGNGSDNSSFQSGAVYVFTRSGTTWSQQAYVKWSSGGAGVQFGAAVALSADGNVLAAGAPLIGPQVQGATVIFTRASGTWSQQTSLVPPNNYGTAISLALDGAGDTLIVGAPADDSGSRGVNGSDIGMGAMNSGAVYVYTGAGASWTQQVYLKASNADAGDQFGHALAVSNDGSTLLVGARYEASAAPGFDGDSANNADDMAGAAYLFHRAGSTWSEAHYIKASNPDSMDQFGTYVAMSADGSTLAVTAYGEASAAQGIGGDQTDNSAIGAGAAYVFQ